MSSPPDAGKSSMAAVRSLEVLAQVLLVFVVGKAFRPRDAAAPDDTGLQVGDDGVDLVRGQRARGRIEIIRRSAQRPIVTGANLVGAFIEGRHAGATWAPAADREL